MATKKKCGAEIKLADGQALACSLPAGPKNHPEGTHVDGEHRWFADVVHNVHEMQDPEEHADETVGPAA